MMKHFRFYLLTLLLCAAAGVGLWLFTAGNRVAGGAELKEKPLTLAMTASIRLPESLRLFDRTIAINDMEIYERLDRELTIFTYQHGSTMLSIKRANRYFPMIERILKEQGVPDDFKYLAVVESALDYKAVSPAKAAGMWQFMESTGKMYGLEISAQVDERLDVGKATLAACKYLKNAYREYDDWMLAAASYNAGKGRITGELEKQKGDVFFDLWLNEETTRYLYRIMAIKEVFEHPYRYGFVIKPEHLYPVIDYKELEITTSIPDLASFAKEKGYTYAELKRANPWLRDRSLTVKDKYYTILLPDKKSLHRTPHSKIKVHDPRWVEE